MINYFDGKFHEVNVRLIGPGGVEIKGRSYRRRKALFKFELLMVNDPRRRECPEVIGVYVANKHEIKFPKVGKDWEPKYIYAVEVMTKEGEGIYQIRYDGPVDAGNTMKLAAQR